MRGLRGRGAGTEKSQDAVWKSTGELGYPEKYCVDPTGKMGKGGGDFGARVQIRAHGGSCARTMRSLEDAIRAIGKTGLAFGAARLPRGKGLDVDFAQEKDGDRFVDELRRAGRAPLRVASKTRKLVTHVATCAEFFHSRRRGDDWASLVYSHRTQRRTQWSTRRPYC